jgi:hypothetical protein
MIPDRVGLGQLQSFSTQEVMPRAKFLRLSAELFREMNIGSADIDDIKGLYCARRILPTLADLARYEPSERLDTGGWFSAADKARVSMPDRYSSGRQFTIATLKHNLVQSAAEAYRAARVKQPNADNPSWEELFKYWPKGPRYDLRTEEKEEVPKKLPMEAQPDDDNSSSSSDDEEPPQPVPDETLPDDHKEVHWQLSQGKKGRRHVINCGERACGRTLHLPEDGQGLYSAAATGHKWSPRCFVALPESAKEWWQNQANDSEVNDINVKG